MNFTFAERDVRDIIEQKIEWSETSLKQDQEYYDSLDPDDRSRSFTRMSMNNTKRRLRFLRFLLKGVSEYSTYSLEVSEIKELMDL